MKNSNGLAGDVRRCVTNALENMTNLSGKTNREDFICYLKCYIILCIGVQILLLLLELHVLKKVPLNEFFHSSDSIPGYFYSIHAAPGQELSALLASFIRFPFDVAAVSMMFRRLRDSGKNAWTIAIIGMLQVVPIYGLYKSYKILTAPSKP